MSKKTEDYHREKIVRFTEFRKRMSDPAITEIRAYWEGLRSGASVPARSDVDPRGIQNALEYAFILEKLAPTVARFRLAGMHMSDVLGMEVRGMPFTSFFTPEARAEISRALQAMFDGPQIVDITATAERGIGKPPLSARILLLPLRSDLGDISRVLGCFVTNGKIGRTPRRFAVEAIETTWIDKKPSSLEADNGYKASGRLLSEPQQESLAESCDPGAHARSGFGESTPRFPHKVDVQNSDNHQKYPPKKRGTPFLKLLTFDD